jgi:hypothetical protein
MKIGVCGIACEKCPKMVNSQCPNGDSGCKPKENPFCQISTCAFKKKVALCFECSEFPCETTKSGPVSYGYCTYLSGKG